MSSCPTCGAAVVGQFCHQCGATLAPNSPQAAVAVVSAPTTASRRPPSDRQLPGLVAAGASLVAFLLALAAVGGFGGGKPAGHALSGTFTVAGFGSFDAEGDSAATSVQKISSTVSGTTYDCSSGAGGGFSDIAAGTNVTVTDGSGKVIGTSALTGGVQSAKGCTFDFEVRVPSSDFYKVEVSSRGAQSYSKADLASQGWRVALKLG
jgi:hypothetical protein